MGSILAKCVGIIVKNVSTIAKCLQLQAISQQRISQLMLSNDMEKKGSKKDWDEGKTIFHKLLKSCLFSVYLHTYPPATFPVQAGPSLGLGGEQASIFSCVCSKCSLNNREQGAGSIAPFTSCM